jgi:hypothetical protein
VDSGTLATLQDALTGTINDGSDIHKSNLNIEIPSKETLVHDDMGDLHS